MANTGPKSAKLLLSFLDGGVGRKEQEGQTQSHVASETHHSHRRELALKQNEATLFHSIYLVAFFTQHSAWGAAEETNPGRPQDASTGCPARQWGDLCQNPAT